MLADQAQATVATVAATDKRNVIAVGAVVGLVSLTLDERGMVCDCNCAGESLFKYPRNELVLRHISMLLPQLAEVELIENGQLNPRLRFLCRIGRRFQAVTQDGERFASEIFLSLLNNTGHGRLSLIVRPVEEAPCDDGLRAPGD